MTRIAALLRAARTIIRAKTTPYTAACLGWTVVAFAMLAYLSTRGAGLWVAVSMGFVAVTFYGAGRYAALDRAERELAPYTVEIEGDEEWDELPSR